MLIGKCKLKFRSLRLLKRSQESAEGGLRVFAFSEQTASLGESKGSCLV